jgi:hypothetical protein
MERDVPMIRRLATVSILALLLILGPITAVAQDMHTLVLVAGQNSDIPKLTAEEVRSTFMGAPEVKNNVRLRPVLNETDSLLREVFLQKVMFVSWKHYQQRLVEQAFRAGWPMPQIVTDQTTLAQVLQEQPGAVTYMWEENAKSLGVKIVQVLWSGPTN